MEVQGVLYLVVQVIKQNKIHLDRNEKTFFFMSHHTNKNKASGLKSWPYLLCMYVGTLHPLYLLLQTLERAFLQLCETSDQICSKQGSSPQSGPLQNSQSFESGRDESRPILAVGPGAAEEIPKYSGTDDQFIFLCNSSCWLWNFSINRLILRMVRNAVTIMQNPKWNLHNVLFCSKRTKSSHSHSFENVSKCFVCKRP